MLKVTYRRALVCPIVALTVLAPAVAEAGTTTALPGSVAARSCATDWNSAANAHSRSYARELGSHRAFVSIAELAKPNASGKFVTTGRSCVVKLWLAHRPGKWQIAVIIGGALRNGHVSYGTRISPHSATTPRRLHQRVADQFANSRVRADGSLMYAGSSIP